MKPAQHILVIRLSAMGDVAMTVPVLRKMEVEYPDLRFTVLTRKFFAPIFKELQNVEVYEAEVEGKHHGIAGLKRLAGELRNQGIDAVADLHNVLRSNVLKACFKINGIKVKQIKKGRSEKKALTRPRNKVFKQLKTTHQRYADVFDALGFPVDVSTFPFLGKRTLSPALREITGPEPKKWIGIAPFAQHASKAYPQDLMKDVLEQLQHQDNLKVFLFGGGEREAAVLDQWEEEFSNAVNVSRKITFEEELDLISNLDAMVSMDSGNGHLAANYGVPVITIWGLTHPYTGFAPYGQPRSNFLIPDLEKYPQIPTSVYGKTIPEGYKDAMRTITPGQVVEKILEVAP